jgi:hypothetical protein
MTRADRNPGITPKPQLFLPRKPPFYPALFYWLLGTIDVKP